VTLWARSAGIVREINEHRTNEKYLRGIRLPAKLAASSDLAAVVTESDVLVMAIPSQNFRSVLESVRDHIRAWVPVISLTKGLEASTRMRMTEVVEEMLPGHPVGVLTGPNLAREIMEGRAAASVLAMKDGGNTELLRPLFNSGLFRVYSNEDVIGCELGGVLKNIIAIAVGMGDGLGAGDNTRAGLITRGLAEITRLGVALGGRPETFAGLAGMGDLIATCVSPQSRNRHVGLELGRGRHIEEIIRDMVMVAEGVKSAPVVLELAKERGIRMPIAEDVYKVLTGESTAQRAFRCLLRVSAGAESEPG
jgi:glycerol-3-phosphate dehydrogenase (NAD(P)+)